MRYYALVTGYLAATTLAIILFKQGTARSTWSIAGGSFSGTMDARVIAGVALYVVSFTLWLVILAARPVAYIVPLTTALVHISIIGSAVFFLHERVSWTQLAGVALVILGAMLIALKAP